MKPTGVTPVQTGQGFEGLKISFDISVRVFSPEGSTAGAFAIPFR